MARLNEPVMSTESLEILRRRFLRQNRDIARINSTQSLKIRSLENECARLLSENLQLRSDVLRLKTELEGSHAHRIADHALQIKEKMEAQLLEWGAMLAGLGHEPLPKNRSPRALKKPRIQRSSIGRNRGSDWRRRETISSMEDLETAALQEGRLPPLWENKTYPRETLSRDEILALCSEAEESTDSPDLGPPPVSRFVDEDPVKLDLSTLTKLLTPALSESDNSGPEDGHHTPTRYPHSPVTKTQGLVEESEEDQIESPKETTKITMASELEVPSQAAKSNLKRKSREEDEKENVPFSAPLLASTVPKNQLGKAAGEKPKPTNRPIKELPLSKRDARDKSSHVAQRKPLAAKSSNEALSSAKKSTQAPAEGKKGKAEEPPSVPETAPVIDIEPESLPAEPNVVVPDSPEPSVPREKMNETPPPVDISSKGETTRANRRARAAVSYAEPNLRDKMRRPNTKQLFDAVTSENKNIRRASQCQRDEPSSVPSSVVKSAARSESSRKDTSSRRTPNDAYQDADIMASPLIQKTTRTPILEELPATVTTDRKKKDSVAATQGHETNADAPSTTVKGPNRRLEEIAAREAEVAKLFSESDVYEFTDSSPTDISKEPTAETSRKTKSGRQSRSRRLSSIAHEDLQADHANQNQNEKTSSRPTGYRKRASMATVKSVKSEHENMRSESPSIDGDSVSTVEGDGTTHEKPTSNRRRTTMI
ncbi:hypothetical protein GQX73_g3144 [Xylaria multiplex]|uniref:Shugoshin C-terminal domain-containing protein n=1 Tax=Xylaria multiplex TaxID=323545 RepID=A0A7C8N7S5_9PEZI|nr:hypothetical protein GQX73_g3144 [Xylaria multiplex]